MRPVQPAVTGSFRPEPLPPNHGKRRAWFAVLLSLVLVFILFLATHQGSATANSIRSGASGACLDVRHGATADGTPVDAARCNGTAAQDWTTTPTTIRQANTETCVTAASSGLVTVSPCSDAADQVWLRDGGGYFNPASEQCLSTGGPAGQLELAGCGNLSSAQEEWSPGSAAATGPCSGDRSEKVACNAVKEWTAWQQEGSNHEALLTTYTDGTPYEEWCADFVSYVYKESGYPFTDGSADGWDENNANDVQYMGFTMHMAGSGYQPKPGDVAFFNYPGGHVEIVVSGGPKPTFVYGDSAQIDPTTGNGQMKANTITHDSEGGLEYYLSPV